MLSNSTAWADSDTTNNVLHLTKNIHSCVGVSWLLMADVSVCLLDQDGLVVQISCTVGEDKGLNTSVVFHLHPDYPSCPPDISISSTHLSRTQCHSIRQKLLDRAAGLPPEPMLHQLVEYLQVNSCSAFSFCVLRHTPKQLSGSGSSELSGVTHFIYSQFVFVFLLLFLWVKWQGSCETVRTVGST